MIRQTSSAVGPLKESASASLISPKPILLKTRLKRMRPRWALSVSVPSRSNTISTGCFAASTPAPQASQASEMGAPKSVVFIKASN